MTLNTALKRAVTALLRRVVVRRLLVVLGLAAAGWLIGGASQASADVTPADAQRVVNDAPVIGNAVRAAKERVAPVRPVRVVRDAVKKPRAVEVPQVVEQPVVTKPERRPEVAQAAKVEAQKVRPVAKRAVKRLHKRVVHKELGGVFTGSFEKNASHSGAAEQVAPVAPITALAQAGGVTPAAGLILFGGIGTPLARRAWVLGRQQGVLLRVPGVVPPVVRTAADEPSFAPD